MLNPGAPIPLYHQLAEKLETAIRNGTYQSGTQIPPEMQISSEFKIGRPTVRQAIDVLVRKGLLIRKRGSGTFVTEPNEEIDILSLDATISHHLRLNPTLKREIVIPVKRLLLEEKADNALANRWVYSFTRITFLGDVAILLEELFLDAALFVDLEKHDLSKGSLSQLVESQYSLRPTGGRQRFQIEFPDKITRELMGVPEGVPLLMVKRNLHFPPLENGFFSLLHCRTDKVVFTQTLGNSYA